MRRAFPTPFVDSATICSTLCRVNIGRRFSHFEWSFRMALLDDLSALAADAKAAFGAAQDMAALEAARVEFLGTRGRLKQLLGRMGEVPKEEKPAVGKRANEM